MGSLTLIEHRRTYVAGDSDIHKTPSLEDVWGSENLSVRGTNYLYTCGVAADGKYYRRITNVERQEPVYVGRFERTSTYGRQLQAGKKPQDLDARLRQEIRGNPRNIALFFGSV